ncbi:hypothetical protein GCM10023238_39080 [Streptomyces heliomycini]
MAVNAKKIAVYILVVFVLYLIITDPGDGGRLRPDRVRGHFGRREGRRRLHDLAGQRRKVMIRHLVLFRLNEGVERATTEGRGGRGGLRSLGGRIPEIRFWECAWNISDRPSPTTSPINSAFEDADALRRYVEHPEHRRVSDCGASSPRG